jgi:ribonuclease HII
LLSWFTTNAARLTFCLCAAAKVKLRSCDPSVLRFAPRAAIMRSMSRGRNGRKASEKTPARLPLGEEIARPTFRRERAALKRGVWPVAGCDEAGRGPLAGPVVAAAVILNPDDVPRGLDDSKRLTPERREVLYERICARAQVAVAMAPPSRIDRDNILRASLWALARAVVALPVRPRLVFVDGRDRIDAGCDCQAVIGGDGLVASIAAASIVAKVTRDRLMACLGAAHPGYGFERHMGYSVPEHFAALDRLGPTIHHRRSFSPVAGALGLTDADADEAIVDVLPL